MGKDFLPAYVTLLSSGELTRRASLAHDRLRACTVCPRNCGVNRLKDAAAGVCRTGEFAIVASYSPHFGEENPLRGYRGSGTIFFSWCNLKCCFCQNYDISQLGSGQPVTPERLASIMLQLQEQGCHNINLVSPSHVVPQILAALLIAAEAGLRLPLVYNTGGYDSLETLDLLDGVVDIYMPDIKYADPAVGKRLSGVSDYPEVNRIAIREMYRQVGDLEMDRQGVATRGLLVRHLVLPNDLAGTASSVQFLAKEVSRNTYLNVMAQYRPCYQADKQADLDRPITSHEYQEAVRLTQEAGLTRLDRRKSLFF